MVVPEFRENGLFASSALPQAEGMLPFCLSGLNRPWEQVLEYGTNLAYSSGSILTSDPDSRYFYFLKSGTIQTWFEDDNGDRMLHLFLRPGMLFQDMICLSALHKNDYVIFMEDSEVVRFDKNELFTPEFCQTYPHLLLNLASSLARKGVIFAEFRNPGTHLEIINQVARIFYTVFVNDINSAACLTQENIARMLKVHRSSVARVVKRLKEQGILIKSPKNHIAVLDMDRLRLYALGKAR